MYFQKSLNNIQKKEYKLPIMTPSRYNFIIDMQVYIKAQTHKYNTFEVI